MLAPRKKFHAIFDNEDLKIIYMVQRKIVTIPTTCTLCQGTVKQYSKQLRCSTKSCRKHFFTVCYWVENGQIETVMGISNVAVTSIARNLLKLVSDALDFNDIITCGDGIISEIDEAKFGKVKYYHGHRVNYEDGNIMEPFLDDFPGEFQWCR
ncbi:hypothetical protein HZS_3788, partial [Henneguya salminicola]